MELQQESIPVGCVPLTCLPGKCCPRVVLSGGRCVQSGGAVQGILSMGCCLGRCHLGQGAVKWTGCCLGKGAVKGEVLSGEGTVLGGCAVHNRK